MSSGDTEIHYSSPTTVLVIYFWTKKCWYAIGSLRLWTWQDPTPVRFTVQYMQRRNEVESILSVKSSPLNKDISSDLWNCTQLVTEMRSIPTTNCARSCAAVILILIMQYDGSRREFWSKARRNGRRITLHDEEKWGKSKIHYEYCTVLHVIFMSSCCWCAGVFYEGLHVLCPYVHIWLARLKQFDPRLIINKVRACMLLRTLNF